MEQKQDDTSLPSTNYTNTSLPGDSKLKAELTLLHKKYIRLEQKEKRIQVRKFLYCLGFHRFSSSISNCVVNGMIRVIMPDSTS